MPRYKIKIEYDGSNISGWQRQANASSIQQFIEEAIESFSKERVSIYGAGRTDAGVHAYEQVAHFDLTQEFHPHVVRRAINHFLKPNKIIILDCSIADNDFHARFSAKRRHYLYFILNRQSPSVLDHYRSWHIHDSLDIERMQLAANILIGKHDFTSFRATHCQSNSPIKTIDEIKIFKEGDKIIFSLKAMSFLHHMVRNIIGSLALVGKRKWEVEDFRKALEAKSRDAAGPTAPAHGLYFTKIEY